MVTKSLHYNPKKIRLILAFLVISALFFGMYAAAEPTASVSQNITSRSVGNETALTDTPVVTPTSAVVTPAANTSAPGLRNGTTTPAAPALAPVNPKFLEYKNRSKTSDIQKTVSRRSATVLNADVSTSHAFVEGEVPSPVDLTHTRGQHITTDSGSATVQQNSTSLNGYVSTFDLRTLGKVSTVEDQGIIGSCWAFATYGSLESTLLTAESWNFSENNMKNTLASTYTYGFDRAWNDGGQEWMSTAYLTRWSGPIRESDDPYSDSSGVSPSGLTTAKHVQNVNFLPARASPTDNDNIKSALTTSGAVKASIYWDAAYYNSGTYAFYNGVSPSTNHAITIVGWDDAYSASNFTSVPAGDGAFIVKNSWGPGWGDAGYFYVSYYDLQIGDRCVVFFAEPATNYDSVYSYDPLGWVYDYGYSSLSAQYANVYTSQSAEKLKAVGFYTTDSNATYVVKIYRSPNTGPINTSGYVSTASGTLSSPGYHTVTVPDVALTAGQKYSIVVSVTNPTYQYPVAIEYPEPGYSSHAKAHAGESYVSGDGGATWADLTTIYTNTNVCLKGYTMTVPIPAPVAAFSGTPVSGTAPLAVQFTDISSNSPTSWNWSFGDGTFSSLQNPSYTYTSAGTYTVALNATNAWGSNTTTRAGYITVSTPGGGGSGGGGGGSSHSGGPVSAVKNDAIVPQVAPVMIAQGQATESAPVGFPGLNYNGDGTNTLSLNLADARSAGATVTIYFNRIQVYQYHSPGVMVTFWGDAFSITKENITGNVSMAEFVTDPISANLTMGIVSGSVHAILPSLASPTLINSTLSGELTPDTRYKFRNLLEENNLSLESTACTLRVDMAGLKTGPANVTFTIPPSWVNQNGGKDAVRIIRISNETGRSELADTVYIGLDGNGNMIFRGDSPQGTSLFGLVTTRATAIEQKSPHIVTGIPASKSAMTMNVGPSERILNQLRNNPILIVIMIAALVAIAYFGWWRHRL